MRIKIYLECDNDAFSGNPLPEITRILETVPGKIRKQMARKPSACNAPESSDKLMDINGNTVGRLNVDRSRD